MNARGQTSEVANHLATMARVADLTRPGLGADRDGTLNALGELAAIQHQMMHEELLISCEGRTFADALTLMIYAKKVLIGQTLPTILAGEAAEAHGSLWDVVALVEAASEALLNACETTTDDGLSLVALSTEH